MSTQQVSGDIYRLIPKVMADIGAIGKNRKNEQQKYAFRGIEDFYQAAHPAMIQHGIFCAPQVVEREAYRYEKTNNEGRTTAWVHVALKVDHKFYAADGSFVTVTTCGEGLDNSDKATNKAMSGAMKYALIELFCVPTQDVEDSDRDSPEAGIAKPRQSVQVTEKAIPLTPGVNERIMGPAEMYITPEQASKLHGRFRDSLREDVRSNADTYLYDFLATKMIFDAQGNPSASAIPKDSFATIGKAAVAFAKEL